MVRRSVLGFICLVLAASLAFAPLGASAAKGKIYKSTENGVRIRQKAQSGSTIIGKLKKGEKVIHLSTKNNWWRIKTAKGFIAMCSRPPEYYKTYEWEDLQGEFHEGSSLQ
jgi:uncharacterized protein YgiM (DUF1202 family)